ncbi:MAG: hypothetical protein IT361_07625 [Gemmatimonadaceae bacterium]|nr:hypothetical protein [Gemmatimonadaceae bacterium]
MTLLRSLFLAFTLSCLGSPTAPGLDIPLGPGRRVLFIGNSLTYVNDLPSVVVAIARAAGDTVEARTVAFPDFALEDHWNEGTARRALRAAAWDFVVMQQGPSSLPDNQAFLRTWTERFAPEIRAAGATPALYMVWPSLARQGDWPGVRAAYKNAATSVQGIFLPAGEAWRLGLSRNASLAVYGADGFHPSPTGTILAGLVIYERLSGRNITTIPFADGFGGLSRAAWQELQLLAHETVEAEKAAP